MWIKCLLISVASILLLAGQALHSSPCVDFNEGAAIAAAEGVGDVFVCPNDGIGSKYCTVPFPTKPVGNMRSKTVAWADIVVLVDYASSPNSEALLWWAQLVTAPMDMVLVDAPCGGSLLPDHDDGKFIIGSNSDESSCNSAVLSLKKQLLRTRRHLHVEIVRPPVTALLHDTSRFASRRSYRLLYGLLGTAKLFPLKKFVFKLDPDSILFPHRFFDFLSTLITLTNHVQQPLYFGTLRRHTNATAPATATAGKAYDVKVVSEEINCMLEPTDTSEYREVCYADEGSGFGLNMLALKIMQPVIHAALQISSSDSSRSGDNSRDNGNNDRGRIHSSSNSGLVQYPIYSVGALLSDALAAYSADSTTETIRVDNSSNRISSNSISTSSGNRVLVIHCGSFGASDAVVNDTSSVHQAISFHSVDSKWLSLSKNRLISHYDSKYHGVKSQVRDQNAEMYIPTAGNPMHPDFTPGSGDEHGLKVLIVSSDNRPLSGDLNDHQYYAVAAALQLDYCRRHNYDYLRILLDTSQVLSEVQELHPKRASRLAQWGLLPEAQRGELLYHPGHGYFRRTSWGRLPALWHAIAAIGHRYDYVWFLDSDAAPNSIRSACSLGEKLQQWAALPPEQLVLRGNKNISEAQFLFLSNFPWRDDLPCAGSIMIRPNNFTLSAVQEWWDYDLPNKNVNDFLEQDALWYMLLADESRGFPLNAKTVSLLSERQIPSSYDGVSSLWLVHLINYDRNRLQYLLNLLRAADMYGTKRFMRIITVVSMHNTIQLDVMETAERMENSRGKPLRAAADYPPHLPLGKEDDEWHLPRHMDQRPAPDPNVGRLYNGFAIRKDGKLETYLVFNDTRHLFPNHPVFLRMGFDLDLVLVFRNWEHTAPNMYTRFLDLDQIPEGSEIPLEGLSANVTGDFRAPPKYYR